jgi:hypothetical protein
VGLSCGDRPIAVCRLFITAVLCRIDRFAIGSRTKELIDRYAHITGTTSPSTANVVWWRLILLVLGMELALHYFSGSKNIQVSPRFGRPIWRSRYSELLRAGRSGDRRIATSWTVRGSKNCYELDGQGIEELLRAGRSGDRRIATSWTVRGSKNCYELDGQGIESLGERFGAPHIGPEYHLASCTVGTRSLSWDKAAEARC